MLTQSEIFKIRETVKAFFRDDKGDPFVLTDGQCELFALIYKKKYPRVHIETHTRYGKSEVISMAILLRAATFPEKWAIVAGNKDKARIIMQYAIKHIFDSDYTRQRFIIEKGENEENIRRYRNKDRINFTLEDGKLGEVFITTAAGALGFGAPNVVEDEAALIPDKEHALVMRMLGDQPVNFLCKVGNPWDMEHFNKSHDDPAYVKFVVDYAQGVREGRLLPAYVDEMRKQPFFDVLYECKRPAQGRVDDKGWIPLLTKDEVDRAMVKEAAGFGVKKLGVDVAGGGRNFSVIVQRHTNVARIVLRSKDPDTMNLAESVINRKAAEKLQASDIAVDKVGVGKGIYDILNRTKETAGVYGVNGAEDPTTAENRARFINIRAEMFWKTREWILAGGKLVEDQSWYELTKVKYKTKLEGTRGKMLIQSKELMLKDGVDSPDVADALSYTFRSPDVMPVDEEDVEEDERKSTGEWDPHHPFPSF